MVGGRGIGARVAVVALLFALLAGGVASGAAGSGRGNPDVRFGKDGRVVVSLPKSKTPSRFGPVIPAAGGGYFVAHVLQPVHGHWSATIERRGADGALDPTFAQGGSATVPSTVGLLAEYPGGGLVYAGGGEIRRVLPNGKVDGSFGKHGAIPLGFAPASIVVDAAGRILVGGRFYNGARYVEHEGETVVMRFTPEGRPDPTFGTGGADYLSGMFVSGGSGELGLLPDGSMLVLDSKLKHLSADGAVLPTPEIAPAGDEPTLATFADGSFAISSSLKNSLLRDERSGCAVNRYGADGSLDPAYGQGGVFSDPDLSRCRLLAAPEGGLLLRGTTATEGGETVPELLLLDATGSPAGGFGTAGAVRVPAPVLAEGKKPWALNGVAYGSAGQLVVAAGGSAAALVGLEAKGARDPGFGRAGTIVESSNRPSSAAPMGIAAMPDGELIVTGWTDSGTLEHRFFWMRFRPDGRIRLTPPGARFATIAKGATQLHPAGARYVYAFVPRKGDKEGSIGKFELDGSLVGGFGAGGRVDVPDGFFARTFLVDPDGGVTVLGSYSGHKMAAYRLDAAGRPELDFGDRGLATVAVRGGFGVEAQSGALRPDGNLVVVGPTQKRVAIAEFGPHGGLRRSFGHNGVLICGCGGTKPYGSAAVADRGSVYVLDHWTTGRDQLIKVGATGLDRSFAGRGFRTVHIGSALGLFVHGDRLLALGWQGEFDGPAQVRAFHLDGAEDRSFAHRKTVTVEGGDGVAELAAAMQPDGSLVLAGERGPDLKVGTRLELLRLR